MKKTIILFLLFFSIIGQSQETQQVLKGGLETAFISKQHLTTAQRDAIVIESGKTYEIYNITTAQFEYWDGASWQAVSGWGGIASQEFNPLLAMPFGNSEFMVVGTAILRNNATPVMNTGMGWYYLDDGSHEPSFFNGISAVGNVIQLQHPAVKKVLTSSINMDETWGRYNANVGASVGTTQLSVNIYQMFPNGFRLTGNGTSSWTLNAKVKDASTIDAITVAGLTRISNDYSGSSTKYTGLFDDGVLVTYQGSNDYRVRQEYNTGSDYDVVKFYLVDNATGLDVTTNPTSDDKVIVSNYGTASLLVGLQTWNTRGSTQNSFLGAPSGNIWLNAIYEAWMKVWVVSDTSLRAKWQEKSGVTTYKLYRATNATFTGATLIYSGTAQQYLDTGLTADSQYWYRLDDQTDTEITSFTQRTRPTALQN